MKTVTPLKLGIAKKLAKDKKYRIRFFKGQMEDIVAMIVGKLRKQRGLSQSDLAKKANTSRSTISAIENAMYSITGNFMTLFDVVNALDGRLRISIEPAENVIKQIKEREER